MKVRTTLLAAVAAVGCLNSCDTYEGRGAAYGAGTGAIIGGLATNRVHGAATGAAIGAGVGALVGALIHENEREQYYRSAPPEGYPYAQRTGYPGVVRSPFYPYNLIDVHGIPPGALVLDPSVNRPFLRP
ncbi:MAG TPA: glycine zipper domain-containing protein [Chthoniobacterales bacterium]